MIETILASKKLLDDLNFVGLNYAKVNFRLILNMHAVF